jgi:hypothetical protein
MDNSPFNPFGLTNKKYSYLINFLSRPKGVGFFYIKTLHCIGQVNRHISVFGYRLNYAYLPRAREHIMLINQRKFRAVFIKQ